MPEPTDSAAAVAGWAATPAESGARMAAVAADCSAALLATGRATERMATARARVAAAESAAHRWEPAALEAAVERASAAHAPADSAVAAAAAACLRVPAD